MASIHVTDSNKYRVVYDVYITDNSTGKKKRVQKQDTFETELKAKDFKLDIEYQTKKGTLKLSEKMTMAELFEKWLPLYARKKWKGRTYDTNVGLIRNHILPYFGETDIDKIRSYDVEVFIDSLTQKKIKGFVTQNKSESEIPYLSSTTAKTIYQLLKVILNKAVEWGVISANPVLCEAPKKLRPKNKQVWSFDDWYNAMDDVQDKQLKLALLLGFTCSLRPSEIVGIRWKDVDFENNRVNIETTIQRYSLESIELLPGREIIHIFPEKSKETKSRLVLKDTKNEDSKRYILMTKQLWRDLLERRTFVDINKAYYKEQYHDYDLVFSLDNGDPIEEHLLRKRFNKWKKSTKLEIPNIQFSHIRHSSSTFKMKESGGDIKSVIADTGHSTPDVLLKHYAQSNDRDRMELIHKMEERLDKREQNNGADPSYVVDNALGAKMLSDIFVLIKKNPHIEEQVMSILGNNN